MNWNREWWNASKDTFSMKPLTNLFYKYKNQENPDLIIDPFARFCRLANVTNDLDPQAKTDYNLDAVEFMKTFESGSVDMVLFDPPFTPRQVSECYKKLNRTVNKEDTQYIYWRNFKNEIMRILKVGGICISCGYNSNGVGIKNGFEIIEGLNIAHGGGHNDTIITVERKIQMNMF